MEDYLFAEEDWNWLAGGIALVAGQAVLPAVLKESLPVRKIRCIMVLLGSIGRLKFAVEWHRYLREQKRILEGK